MAEALTFSRRDVIGSGLALGALSLAGAPAFAQGAGASSRLSKAERFTFTADQAQVDDLKARIRAHRWGRAPAAAGWKHGVDQAWLKGITDHWANGFDFAAAERSINALPQYTANVEGRDLHFAYLAGSGRAPKPIVLLHGWPYSFYTFAELAPRLANPERFGGDAEDGFDVVVPSLPGMGFSEPPTDAPKGLRFIAGRINGLMTDVLGYDRYIAQGGDFGAVVAEWLAIDHAPQILGVHQNMIGMRHEGGGIGQGTIGAGPPGTPAEKAFVAKEQQHFALSGQFAYFAIQMARPTTVGNAVGASPVGMAAWMLEKWHFWTDQRQRPLDQIYGRDKLLTEVSLYWLSKSFETSLWPYAGYLEEGFALPRRIEAPVAVMAYPDPLTLVPPRSFVERSRNVVRWTERPAGGHFPFIEDRDAFAADIRAFARSLS